MATFLGEINRYSKVFIHSSIIINSYVFPYVHFTHVQLYLTVRSGHRHQQNETKTIDDGSQEYTGNMIRKVFQTATMTSSFRRRYFPLVPVPIAGTSVVAASATLTSIKDHLSSCLQSILSPSPSSSYIPPTTPQLVVDGQFVQHPFLDYVGDHNGIASSDWDLSSSAEHQQQQADASSILSNPFWFAVPKSKHTRSRKRMKTTRQKRLPLKKNIVFDPRTGEVTLKHKLPFNWKDYLPKVE